MHSIGFHNPFSSLYEEAQLPRVIARSLNLMLLGNLFGNLCGVICGGGTSAMIGLANELHAGDLEFGLLNGIPQAAALLQIPFSMLVNRTHKRKKYLLTYGLFSRVLWLFFGLIPLVVPTSPEKLRIWTLLFLLGISSCCSAVINVCWFPWYSDLAPLSIRGRWFSTRDTIASGLNLVFGLVVARLLDTLPPQPRYVIVFLMGGLVGMADMICFGFCKEVFPAETKRLSFRDSLSQVLGNKPFVRLMVMWTAWCFTANLCEPYLIRYSVNEMGLSFTQITIFGTAAQAFGTMLVMTRWGKAMDRIGGRRVMLTAALGGSVVNLFYLFSTPGSVWPVFARFFTGALFWSGTNLAATGMQLSCSPDETRSTHVAVFSCVTSLLGTALGTLLGGLLLEGFAKAGWFTGAFDRYKVLILLSVVLRLAASAVLVPPLKNGNEDQN